MKKLSIWRVAWLFFIGRLRFIGWMQQSRYCLCCWFKVGGLCNANNLKGINKGWRKLNVNLYITTIKSKIIDMFELKGPIRWGGVITSKCGTFFFSKLNMWSLVGYWVVMQKLGSFNFESFKLFFLLLFELTFLS